MSNKVTAKNAHKGDMGGKVKGFVVTNIVPIVFSIVCLIGVYFSGSSIPIILMDVVARFNRNAILVLSLIIPILSGISSFLMSWLSMKNNAMPNDGASAGMNRSMMIMMPLMSVWIAFQVPAGVGIYWLLSNVIMLVQQYVLGRVYNPREMAEKAKAELEAQREAERQEKIEARREAKEKQAEKNRQAAEAAKNTKKGRKPARVEEETLVDLAEDDEIDEKALTQKEINRMKLAAARKRDAERYGEEYVEVEDRDLE